MTDSVLENAIAERKALRARLREVEAFIASYRRFSGTEAPKRVATPGQPQAFAEVVATVLREEGPLTLADLVSQIEARQIIIPSEGGGRNKRNYVNTIVWRNKDRFHKNYGRGERVSLVGAA